MMLFWASLFAIGAGAGALPELEAEDLLEREVKFPQEVGGGQPWVIAVGFTKASQTALSKCGDWFESKAKGVTQVSVAVLEGVPFFVKGLVKGGIRKSVPDDRRSRFLLVFDGKETLQKLANFEESTEDLAYVMGVRTVAEKRNVEFSLPGDCTGTHAERILQKLKAGKYL